MYKIIGGDGKEYGPISSEQLRQWLNEGRVNANTRVLLEGTTEWKLLSAFPEFAATVTAPPSAASFSGSGRDEALKALKGPAIALKVTAIIGLVLVVFGLVMNVLALSGVNVNWQPAGGDPQMERMFASWNKFGGALGIVTNIIGAIVGVVIFMGASKMQKLERHGFALTASILAMIPCVSPCCLLGLPFGIWALVVLNKPEVKSQFT
jgi:hypothetical protein